MCKLEHYALTALRHGEIDKQPVYGSRKYFDSYRVEQTSRQRCMEAHSIFTFYTLLTPRKDISYSYNKIIHNVGRYTLPRHRLLCNLAILKKLRNSPKMGILTYISRRN